MYPFFVFSVVDIFHHTCHIISILCRFLAFWFLNFMTAFLIKSVGFGSIATAITKLLRRLNDKETKPSSRARFKKQSNRINRIIPYEPVKKISGWTLASAEEGMLPLSAFSLPSGFISLVPVFLNCNSWRAKTYHFLYLIIITTISRKSLSVGLFSSFRHRLFHCNCHLDATTKRWILWRRTMWGII